MTPAKTYPLIHTEKPGKFCRATATHAVIDHPEARGGRPDQMRMSDNVLKMIQNIPASSPVIMTYTVDDYGAKTLTAIRLEGDSAPAAVVPKENEAAAGHARHYQQNANTALPVAITTKDRLIILQSSLKVAGELYGKIECGNVDANGKGPAIVMEWARYFADGIILYATRGGE